MSYQEDRLTEIADAIRSVKDTTGTIKATDFAEEIKNISISKAYTSTRLFRNCEYLTEIGSIDISNFTNMTEMFSGCVRLIKIPPMDTSQVITMKDAFKGCRLLTDIMIDVSGLNSPDSIGGTFEDCESLKYVTFHTSGHIPVHQYNTFRNSGISSTTGTIYVPDNLVNAWKESPSWLPYASRIKPLSERL